VSGLYLQHIVKCY